MKYSYNEFINLKNNNKTINSDLKLKLNNIITLIDSNLLIYKKKEKYNKNNYKSNNYNSNSNSNSNNNVNNNNNDTWRIKKTVFKKQITSNNEIYENNINMLLNKLSPKNFDIISSKITTEFQSLINDEKLSKENINNSINIIINNIFSKAVMQYIYCPYYVKLIDLINNNFEIINLINSKCHEYKNMILKQKENINVNMTDNEKYDEFCKEIKSKIFKEGYSQFIGELYNNNMLKEEIILEYILFFIENLENDENKENIEYIEYNIICCIKLLLTIKINYDKISSELKRFYNISNNNIPKRLKFKLLDLKDNLNS